MTPENPLSLQPSLLCAVFSSLRDLAGRPGPRTARLLVEALFAADLPQAGIAVAAELAFAEPALEPLALSHAMARGNLWRISYTAPEGRAHDRAGRLRRRRREGARVALEVKAHEMWYQDYYVFTAAAYPDQASAAWAVAAFDCVRLDALTNFLGAPCLVRYGYDERGLPWPVIDSSPLEEAIRQLGGVRAS